jgi:hypothetical protein
MDRNESAAQVNDASPIDCRAEARRCLTLARVTNDPYIRRALTKIADSYSQLADWIEGEMAAGRRNASDL